MKSELKSEIKANLLRCDDAEKEMGKRRIEEQTAEIPCKDLDKMFMFGDANESKWRTGILIKVYSIFSPVICLGLLSLYLNELLICFFCKFFLQFCRGSTTLCNSLKKE